MSIEVGKPDGGELDALVERALTEDVGEADWTTRWTIEENSRSVANIVAQEALIVAGSRVAERVFRRIDRDVIVEILTPDGSGLVPGALAMRIEGSTRALLTGERVALNFLGHLSGVATATHHFVAAVEGTGAVIVDTRKTTPGLRLLEKAAVVAGGGLNHRIGLHDMVLVKDNHIDAAGGVTAAVERVRRLNAPGLPVEVEVRTLTELDEVLRAGVDRILLDNMSLDTLGQAVELVRSRAPTVVLEASGNVTLKSVRAVAECGVNLISVGALTHSSRSVDLSMSIDL